MWIHFFCCAFKVAVWVLTAKFMSIQNKSTPPSEVMQNITDAINVAVLRWYHGD